jgi:hypothetical protein
MTMLLTIMTKTMRDYGISDNIFYLLNNVYFWTSGCGWSYSTFQGAGHFQTIHTQDTQTFWNKKFINYVTCLVAYMIWISREGQDMCNCRHNRNTCNCDNWQKMRKDLDKGYIWTSLYWPTYLTIWWNRKSAVMGQLDLTERAFHRTCYHETNDWNDVIFILAQEMTWWQLSGDKRDIYILTNMHNPPTNGIWGKKTEGITETVNSV